MKDFPPKQQKGIAALLTEKDVRAAAAKAGISEVTLYRWMQEPEFKAEYRRLRREAVEQAAARLQQASAEAVETLQRNLTCGSPSAEINAAKTILEQSVKAIELLDLQERLEGIEDELKRQNPKN